METVFKLSYWILIKNNKEKSSSMIMTYNRAFDGFEKVLLINKIT